MRCVVVEEDHKLEMLFVCTSIALEVPRPTPPERHSQSLIKCTLVDASVGTRITRPNHSQVRNTLFLDSDHFFLGIGTLFSQVQKRFSLDPDHLFLELVRHSSHVQKPFLLNPDHSPLGLVTSSSQVQSLFLLDPNHLPHGVVAHSSKVQKCCLLDPYQLFLGVVTHPSPVQKHFLFGLHKLFPAFKLFLLEFATFRCESQVNPCSALRHLFPGANSFIREALPLNEFQERGNHCHTRRPRGDRHDQPRSSNTKVKALIPAESPADIWQASHWPC